MAAVVGRLVGVVMELKVLVEEAPQRFGVVRGGRLSAAERACRGAAALEVLGAASRIGPRLEAVIDEAVGVARAGGATWTQIGAALGISKQAAYKRFYGVQR